MASVARTSNVGSFNWSDTAAWTTGVVPLVTDTVTIPVGSTITFDVDQTSWAASGLGTLTINGVLQASTTAGTYSLRMAGNITGTGVLRAGSSGARYPSNCAFSIYLQINYG